MPQARVRQTGGASLVGRAGDHAAAVASACGQAAAAAGGRQPAAARVSGARPDAADAGLGQHELDAARALPVAGERGDDRADLLVAGEQQERRRAAVALHADHVDALVGVRELVDAVRRHRAAGVQVRVDQRSERRAASTRSSRSSRSSPSSARSGRKPVAAMISSASIDDVLVGHGHAAVAGETRRVWKPPTSSTEPSSTSAADRRAERAARRQLVVAAAAVLAARRGAADRPDDLRRRLGVAQRHQIEDRVEGRVAAADHEHPPARVARAVGAEHVRDPVGDPVRGGALALRGNAAGAERVRPRPGAGRVDHGRREVAALLAALLDEQLERRLVAARVLELVDAVPGDRDDPGAEVQAPARSPAAPRAARGSARRSRRRSGRRPRPAQPSRPRRAARRDRVDVVLPRREHAHVPPLADARADLLAGLEHQRLDPARGEMRGGGEPDGARADDGDDVWTLGHGRLLVGRASKTFDARP